MDRANVMLERLLHDARGDDLAALINVASDLATAVHICRRSDLARALTDAAATPSGAPRLMREIIDLAELRVDDRFSSPWDGALTLLLVAILDGAPMLAKQAAAKVSVAPSTWWAKRLAEEIRSGQRKPVLRCAPWSSPLQSAAQSIYVMTVLGQTAVATAKNRGELRAAFQKLVSFGKPTAVTATTDVEAKDFAMPVGK